MVPSSLLELESPASWGIFLLELSLLVSTRAGGPSSSDGCSFAIDLRLLSPVLAFFRCSSDGAPSGSGGECLARQLHEIV